MLATPAVNTSRWQPYPAYRPSGVKWLGDIPAHWKVRKLKHAASVTFSTVDKHTFEDEQPVRLCNYVDVYHNDFITEEIEFMQATATPREVVRFTLREADVLVTKDSESWEDIAVSAYVPSTLNNVVCGYHLALVRPDHEVTDGKYLFRAFQARGINDQFRVAANGITRYGLPKNGIDSSLFLVPPLEEQRAIAAFLDRETTRLDALIAKKQRLIELLQEQRTGFISQVVTKGLEPNAPMKYSGAEWLGEIPAHWTASAFKRVASISYGLVLELDRTETQGTNIISLPNVTKDGRLLLDDVPMTRLTEADKKSLLLQKGDLLFNWRNGSADHVGKTAYFDGDGEYTHVSFLLRLRFDSSKHDSHYFHYFLNNLRNTGFFNASKGMVNKTYNQSELGRLIVMVPPLADQRAIAKFLDQATVKIDALIAKTNDAIERLREYRTALIAAAVTGKIKVFNG